MSDAWSPSRVSVIRGRNHILIVPALLLIIQSRLKTLSYLYIVHPLTSHHQACTIPGKSGFLLYKSWSH